MICSCPSAAFSLKDINKDLVFCSYENVLNVVKVAVILAKLNITCDLRDLGIQMIALPSREHVTMLS